MKAKVNLNPFLYFNIEEGTKAYFAHIDKWPKLSLKEKIFYKKAHLTFKRVEKVAYHEKNMQVRRATDTIKSANTNKFNEHDHECAQSLMKEYLSKDTTGDAELNRILKEKRRKK